MVLKLIDICLNYISVNLNRIKSIDSHLTINHKELLIQRLANHNYFDDDSLKSITKYLFTDNIDTIKFYKCKQINDSALKFISKNTRFQLKVLSVCRCINVTGTLLDKKRKASIKYCNQLFRYMHM